MTLANINAAFLTAVGRVHADGDQIAVKDAMDYRYILLYDSSQGGWYGMNVTNGSNVHYS